MIIEEIDAEIERLEGKGTNRRDLLLCLSKNGFVQRLHELGICEGEARRDYEKMADLYDSLSFLHEAGFYDGVEIVPEGPGAGRLFAVLCPGDTLTENKFFQNLGL